MKSEADHAVSESCLHGWICASDHMFCHCCRLVVYWYQASLKEEEEEEREEKVGSCVYVSCVLIISIVSVTIPHAVLVICL